MKGKDGIFMSTLHLYSGGEGHLLETETPQYVVHTVVKSSPSPIGAACSQMDNRRERGLCCVRWCQEIMIQIYGKSMT